MEDESPVEKITLLDVFTDLGLEHEIVLAVGSDEFTLQSSSIFANVLKEAKSCVVQYNALREITKSSQKANQEFLDKFLRDHIRRHGLGIAIPEREADLVLRSGL